MIWLMIGVRCTTFKADLESCVAAWFEHTQYVQYLTIEPFECGNLPDDERGNDMNTKSICTMAVFLFVSGIFTPTWVSGADPMDVSSFIDRVIEGEDYSGQEVVIRGIALGEVSDGDRLVNIGTQATYNSGAYENFVSVYDVATDVREGNQITMRIKIDSTAGYELGGKNFVLIEATYKACTSC